MKKMRRNFVRDFGAKLAFDLKNMPVPQAGLAAPPSVPTSPSRGALMGATGPNPAVLRQQNLANQQRQLDAAIAQKQKELDEQAHAGWRDFGRRSYVTFGSPAAGEALGAVARPVDKFTRWVGGGVRGIGGRLGSWGLQGTAAFGRGMQSMTPAPKPFTPAEQEEYKSFTTRITADDAQPLTPAESARLQALDTRARAMRAAERARSDWGNFATAADQQANALDRAVTENAEMLGRGEIPGSGMKTRIVPGADGRSARVEVVTNDPLRRFYDDNAGSTDPNSALRQFTDISYGVGQGASNMVGVPAAGKLIGAAGTAMQGVNSLQPAANVMQTTGQVLNPSIQQLWQPGVARWTTGGGAVGLGGLGAYDVAQAQTPEERIQAAQNIPGLVVGGALAGNAVGQLAPSLARGAAGAYERALYPGQAAAATPAAVPAAAAPAITAAPTAAAAPAAASTLRGTAGEMALNVAQGAGVTAAQGIADTAGKRQDLDNQIVADSVAPNDVSALNDRQPVVAGQAALNPDSVPSVFLPDASKVMGRTGAGGVGTDAITHPDSGRAMTNDETSDFYRWMQGEGVFKGKDGTPGAIEQQAAQQGQAAFEAARAAGQGESQAMLARDQAYKASYFNAYRENQQTQLSQNSAKIEELQAAGASPAELRPHVDAAVGNFVRGMPEGQRQQATEEAKAYADAMMNPDKPATPAAQKVEGNAQKAFLDNASNTDPPPPDPKGAGDWFSQKMDQFNAMPPAAKLAMGIGLPMMLVGFMSGGDDEEGGGFGMLLSLLGLGAGLLGAAGGGMFGQGAQNAVFDTLGGLGQSAGLIPKELTPEQKSILLAKDPVQAALATGGGNLSREEAAQRVQAARAQMSQLQQLRSVGGMFGDTGQSRLFERMGLTPEEAALATKNVGALTDAYSDPKSPLSQRLQDAQWYADPNQSGLAGWALEKVGPQRAQQLLNWVRGKQGNAHMNIAQQIYLQHSMMKAARCWAGYEPVPGKKPYSNDSCRPVGSKAKKKEPAKKEAASSVFKLNEKKPEPVVNGAKPSTEASKEVSVKREDPKKETDLRPEGVLPSKA